MNTIHKKTYTSKSSLLLFTSLLLFAEGCRSYERNLDGYFQGHDFMEGWAGAPENPKKKPYDYFYMTKRSDSTRIGFKRKAKSSLQESCISSVLEAKPDFMRKLIGETLTGAEGVSDIESAGKTVLAEYNSKVTDLNAWSCRPLRPAAQKTPGIEWEECECIIYTKVPEGKEAIIKRAQEMELKSWK